MRIKHMVIAAAGAALVLGAAPDVRADAVSDFYSKKKIKMIVGGTPGGGYDTYARQLARFLPTYIPGNPGMIVQNMQGAASIRAANFIYNVAEKDGTVMGAVQRTIPVLPLYGKKGLKYDPRKFNWLGSLNNEVSVCVARTDSGVKTINDAMAKELIIGGSGANDTENFPAVLNNMFGTKFKIISGYKGPGITLAMERGEVAGRCGWSWTSLKNQHPDWLKNGFMNILIQLSVEKLDEIKAPLVMELAKNEADRDVLELVFAPQAFGRPFVMPPDVPAARVAAVRGAFAKAAKDGKLIKDLEKIQLDVSLIPGERMQKLITKVLATPKPVIARAADLMKYKGERVKAEVKMMSDSGVISQSVRKGRKLMMKLANGKEVSAAMSRSRSKVTIAGKAAKRGDVKAGMACTFTYAGSGAEAKTVVCK